MSTTTLDERPDVDDLREVWPALVGPERLEGFALLSRHEAEDFFSSLAPRGQAQIIEGLPPRERRLWMRQLDPDDAADVLQEFEPALREELLALLDESTRREIRSLLAHAEDAAGGLMSPRFARIRADMTADEALRYVRRQARTLETLHYAYVLDSEQHLRGVLSFRELFTARHDRPVAEVMHTDVITVSEELDQETVSHLIAEHDLVALPVVDGEGRMRGIVTVDDIVDVIQKETTEDAHKFGGLEALETPYLQTKVLTMVRKRAVWLTILFVGEMLTTNAMSRYQDAIANAVVLALFVPLIISSGGNSGSQAATLVIRAMALGEVRLRDWWRIMRREVLAGLMLGAILATVGGVRVLVWQAIFHSYGDHGVLIGIAVAGSLAAVVLWGTLCGSMLPFILRRVNLDPASASAPFVATLVDVFGLMIYFNIAQAVLHGAVS